MIVKLDPSRIHEVSRAHEELDPDSFLRQAGYGLRFKREILYPAIARSPDAACFIYLFEGKIAGYIGLVKRADQFYRREIVLNNFSRLASLAFLAFLNKPSVISEVLAQIFSINRYLRENRLAQILAALVSFGVLEAYRKPLQAGGRRVRISHELFEAAACQFREWKCSDFKLYTASKNKAALAFYLQRGGRLTDSFGPQVGIYFNTEEVLREIQNRRYTGGHSSESRF